MKCGNCPKKCTSSTFCGGTDVLKLALAALHFGEEPPITGTGGSGTLFFSGCNMKCPFCQNWQISRGIIGKQIRPEELAGIMLKLQSEGAENINFVTGTHFSIPLLRAANIAVKMGLNLPLLWNSSAYENTSTLKELSENIDIWLPDLKTMESRTAKELYRCPDYPGIAKKAIRRMMDFRPLRFDSRGKMLTGTVIRHLILPGHLQSTRSVLEWYAEEAQGKALLSLLSQYTPVTIPGENTPIPQTYLQREEYDQVLIWLEELDIEEGFIQELETGSDWLPDFRRTRPFSSELARVVWTSEKGYLAGETV